MSGIKVIAKGSRWSGRSSLSSVTISNFRLDAKDARALLRFMEERGMARKAEVLDVAMHLASTYGEDFWCNSITIRTDPRQERRLRRYQAFRRRIKENRAKRKAS